MINLHSDISVLCNTLRTFRDTILSKLQEVYFNCVNSQYCKKAVICFSYVINCMNSSLFQCRYLFNGQQPLIVTWALIAIPYY